MKTALKTFRYPLTPNQQIVLESFRIIELQELVITGADFSLGLCVANTLSMSDKHPSELDYCASQIALFAQRQKANAILLDSRAMHDIAWLLRDCLSNLQLDCEITQIDIDYSILAITYLEEKDDRIIVKSRLPTEAETEILEKMIKYQEGDISSQSLVYEEAVKSFLVP